MKECQNIFVFPANYEIHVDVRVFDAYPKFKELMLQSPLWKLRKETEVFFIFKSYLANRPPEDVWADKTGRWFSCVGFSWRIDEVGPLGMYKFVILNNEVM